eukprot:4073504-Pleurochrysis_carterae.AAC.1
MLQSSNSRPKNPSTSFSQTASSGCERAGSPRNRRACVREPVRAHPEPSDAEGRDGRERPDLKEPALCVHTHQPRQHDVVECGVEVMIAARRH